MLEDGEKEEKVKDRMEEGGGIWRKKMLEKT
jgi:hypothetical protein